MSGRFANVVQKTFKYRKSAQREDAVRCHVSRFTSKIALCSFATVATLVGGCAGIRGYQVVVGQTAADSTPTKQLRVDCPAGKKALGAGWSVLDPTDAILEGQCSYFEPAFDGSHWLTNAQNRSAFAPDWKLRVRLICAKVNE